ncbi:DUF7520 family protein [Halobaculum sp. EA56]|uniref:DUF7520 family protein n=1 Tax=Halobaculum sp. EA56 TaxID=3421648 RepID=UPI003EBD84DB
MTVPTDAEGESDGQARRDGPRIVLVLYAVLVGVGAVAGVLVATFVDGLSAPSLFAVIPLPATALGFAVYGGVTIAAVLGVPLALVIYVSRRVESEGERTQ